MKQGAALWLVVLLTSSSAYAQSGNRNAHMPYAGTNTAAQGPQTRDVDSESHAGSFFQLPDWSAPRWPTLPGFSDLRERTSITWNNARQTTRRWWRSTVTAFSPFDSNSAVADKSQKETGGGWFHWAGSGGQEPDIVTVNDFLKQDRPKF